jgi:hypothetical protein
MSDSSKQNAIRAIIRQINAEINTQLAGVAPEERIKSKHMGVIFKIFDKHRETIKLLGFSHTQFLYQMSLINRVIKERD